MKKAWILACTLLFISVAGFADGPAPLSDEALAAILGEPLAGSSCATKAGGMGEMRFVKAVAGEKAFCTVDCPSGTPVSCTSSTDCTAVERNCSVYERGHVMCNGVKTYCTPTCCSGGTPQENACCRCDALGGCTDCCRCAGGTISQCKDECFGPIGPAGQ